MALIFNSDLVDGVYTSTTDVAPVGAGVATYFLANHSGSAIDVTFELGAELLGLTVVRLTGVTHENIPPSSKGTIRLDGDEAVFLDFSLGVAGATRTFRLSRIAMAHGANEFRPGTGHGMVGRLSTREYPPGVYIDRLDTTDNIIPNS